MNEIVSFEIEFDMESDVKRINTKLQKAIDYLRNLKDLSRIFTDFPYGYSALIFIGKTLDNFDIDTYGDDIDVNIFMSNNFEEIISNLLLYLYEIRYELNFNCYIDMDEAEYAININEKHLYVLNYLVFITFELEKNSLEFCNQFVLKKGLKAFLNFLNDENFIKSTHKYEYSEDFSELIDLMVIIVFNLRFSFHDYDHIWKDLDSVNILLKISRIKQPMEFIAYGTIAYIIDSEQLEKYTDEMQSLINNIGILLIQCKKDFSENNFFRLSKNNYFNGKFLYYKSHNIDVRNSLNLPMIYLLDCLYKLSVNDKIRNYIYFKNDLKSCIKVFITKGNLIEINYSLELLWKLSLSKVVKTDLNKDIEVDNILNGLSSNTKAEQRVEKQIYENINELVEKIKLNYEKSTLDSYEPSKNEYIVISYHRSSTNFCLKLKLELESNGYKVWMDTNEKNASRLDLFTKAMNDASYVLICVTESYRESIDCQLEAKYALRSDKKTIPLIIENSFEEDWLSNLIKEKVLVNFTGNSFEICFANLINELEDKLNRKNSKELSKNNSNSVEGWLELDVKNWFIKNNLSYIIFEYFRPFNGKVLKQMFKMKNDSSDYFYQSFNKIDKLKFNDIVLFTSCLDELFHENIQIKK